jgi:predicted transcriptional regulator
VKKTVLNEDKIQHSNDRKGDRKRMLEFLRMTLQEKVQDAVKDLPPDAPIEAAMEQLLFVAKIERGLDQLNRGETVPHDEVKRRLAKWLQ